MVKLRRTAKNLIVTGWIELSGTAHRSFWRISNGVAGRWLVEAIEIAGI